MDAPLRVVGKYAHCQVEGCGQKHKGHGYCEKHLDRLKSNGDPLVVQKRRHSLVAGEGQRFCDDCGEVKSEKDFYLSPRGHFSRLCRPCKKVRSRLAHVARKYGVKGAAVEARLIAQEPCEICGEYKENLMAIDHNHDTDEVCGLLCRNCNSAIGQLGDSVETIQAALEYVRRTR